MGFLDRLRPSSGPQRPKLLKNVATRDFDPRRHGVLQHYVGRDVDWRGYSSVQKLKELPNADDTDVDALVRSVNGVLTLALDLDEVDKELMRASASRLSLLLSDRAQMMEARVGFLSNAASFLTLYQGLDLGERQQELTRWVEENVPQPQDADMLRLVERRGELRQALVEAHQGLLRTCEAIAEAHRRLEIVKAAARLDAEAGQGAEPDLALARSREAEERIEAVSGGISEAYEAAVARRPELAALEAPDAPRALTVDTVAPAPEVEPDPELG